MDQWTTHPMNFDPEQFRARILATIKEVEIKNFRYHVTFRVTALDVSPVAVTVGVDILERDSGAERVALQPTQVPARLWYEPDEAIAQFLLTCFQSFMAHEVAECFLWRGERQFDPHLAQK